MRPPDEEKLKGLLVEFEFNSIGRRLFGEEFKAGRGGASLQSKVQSPKSDCKAGVPRSAGESAEQLVLVSETEGGGATEPKPEPAPAIART